MDEYNKVNDMGQTSPPTQPEKSSGAGSIIGAVIIIVLLAIGAFYFWGAKLNERNDNPPPLILGNETADTDLASDTAAGLPPQQASDDTAAINADIQAMNIDALGAQTASSLEAYDAATQ